MVDNQETLWVMQVNGPDREGLFTQLCMRLADLEINILDVTQSVLRGYLSISFLLDIKDAVVNRDRIKLEMKQLGSNQGLEVSFFDYEEGYRPKVRNLYVLTILGKDDKGILATISAVLSDHGSNIETIKVKVRNDTIFNQLVIDVSQVDDINNLRNDLRAKTDEYGLSMVLEREKYHRKNKKLIAFDMDSTLVKGETIVKIAEYVNKKDEMQRATNQAMETDIDFENSLKERAKLLEGISIETLEEIADDLKITPGAEELIHHLKNMGYQIALISSGFSIFTDAIKQRLNLDYSFGNTLEIKNGVVTGRVIGEIIDGNGKWKIIKQLSEQLQIGIDEIVTVGDGSNDREMLRDSGLGIGYNSKEIASEVADGRIAENDAYTILLMLGLSDTEINEIIHQRL